MKCSNLTDIGVNLTNDRFNKDRSAVIERAQHAGIHRLIITGTNLASSQQALQLSLDHGSVSQLYATAGFHPHNASENNAQTWAQLSQLWQHKNVVAIGETGLDFNRNFSPPTAQLESFEKHLQAAAERQLPLFLHERDAAGAFLELLANYRHQIDKAVLHCFTGTEAFLRQLLDLDIHIGITGWICDERRGGHLHDAVKLIPQNRLMLETDAPYLLPRDMRPKPTSSRNEPAYLRHVCQRVAHYRGQSEDSLALQSEATAVDFFGFNSTQAETE
ncbi:MAG: TatD family hydrolase [Oceanospirillaceae bacterium]|nr:TatD family hydrolase [Oceanospirillaceae bacterium]